MQHGDPGLRPHRRRPYPASETSDGAALAGRKREVLTDGGRTWPQSRAMGVRAKSPTSTRNAGQAVLSLEDRR